MKAKCIIVYQIFSILTFNCNCIERKILNGHLGEVRALAVLKNGDLVSGSSDKTIKIWDKNNDSVKMTLTNHSDEVTSLAVLCDGNLASGSADETIKIWNTNDGSLIRTLKGLSSPVNSLALLSNGDLVSSAGRLIIIWNPNDGTEKNVLHGHDKSVTSVVALSDGFMASCSTDSRILIWNIQTEWIKKILIDYGVEIWTLAVLKNGQLASGSEDDQIRIWDINLGNLVQMMDKIRYIKEPYSPVNNSEENDGNIVNIMDNYDHSMVSYALTILKNGDLASGTENGIAIWDPTNGKFKGILIDDSTLVKSLAVLENGDLAGGYVDGLIRIWKLSDYMGNKEDNEMAPNMLTFCGTKTASNDATRPNFDFIILFFFAFYLNLNAFLII